MIHRIFLIAGILAVVAIPLGTRTLLHSFTPGFHEYEAVFFYVSDIALVLFITLFLKTSWRKALGKKKEIIFLVLFLIFAAGSIIFTLDPGLGWYSFARLLVAVVFAFAIARMTENTVWRRTIFFVLAVLAVGEGVVALLQFRAQGDIGLSLVGESPIGALMPGTAKAILGDARVVRAYGTFPHPNVLGAFLLIGLSALYYAWFVMRIPHLTVTRTNYRALFRQYARTIATTVLLSLGIFIVGIGIVLTFSRIAWVLAAGISLLAVFYLLFFPEYRRQSLKLIVVLLAVGFWLQMLFAPFVGSRAHVSWSEPSVVERISYNRLGVTLIKKHPQGMGIGNQVLRAVYDGDYLRAGMKDSRLWQPIHNTYLLIGAEVGFLGLAAFLVFIAQLVITSWGLTNPLLRIIAYQLFTIVLLFSFFDHFFWTLEQGRLMFWLVIGIVLAVNNTDRDQLRP